MISDFVKLLQRFPEEKERFRVLAQNQLRSTNSERLEDHSFFQGLARPFLNLLRPKCSPQVFFAGEALMQQGDPAESCLILGTDSYVTIEVDGHRIKDIAGRACLGTVALLSKRSIRRAGTVKTRIACTVLELTRSDWLDGLKHYPEHRKWIQQFTNDHLQSVKEERQHLAKKVAWDKIQTREGAATMQHLSRLGLSVTDTSQ